MFRTLFVVTVIAKVHCHVLPLIYAAPSAVSHQSRIDVKHSPGYISAPLIYSPAIIPGRVKELASETVLTPILNTDTFLTPVALTFFHNLPLARALEHPISIDVVENGFKKEDKDVIQPQNDKGISIEEAMKAGKENYNAVQEDQGSLNAQNSSEKITYKPIESLDVVKQESQ